MCTSLKVLSLAVVLSIGALLPAGAQNTITLDPFQIHGSAALGPGGGNPYVATSPQDPNPPGRHVEDLQPGSYVEYRVATATPGMYSIDMTALQPSDLHAILMFESRPYTSPEDPYATRYATQDSKDYGKFGEIPSTFSSPRIYLDMGMDPGLNPGTPPGAIVDGANNVIVFPLWQGDNILRIRNVGGRHSPANSYPPDLSDPNDRPWPEEYFWSLFQYIAVTLNRVGDLPEDTGTVTGTVTGDMPDGIPVRQALVAVGAPGTLAPEPSSFWHTGYYTYTRPDGTYTLADIPAGAMEIEAGRPDSYQVQGSRTIDAVDLTKTAATPVTVPAGGGVASDLRLRSIFHTDERGDLVAYVQAEYFESVNGGTSILPVDGENGYKLGWIDPPDSWTAFVDIPQTGYYEVVSSYDNGGNTGTLKVSTDTGQSATGTQPPVGWVNPTLSAPYSPWLRLPQGTNVVTQKILSGNSDFDAIHLRLLKVGTIQGTVTNTTTGQPLPGATVVVGDTRLMTDAQGRYQALVLAGNGIPVTVSALAAEPGLYRQTNAGASVNLPPDATVTQDFSLDIRPNIVLSTANGYAWKAKVNSGGAADFSAATAAETGFAPLPVPGASLYSGQPGIFGWDRYAWYRVHLLVPSDFGAGFPGRMGLFRVACIPGVERAIKDVDAVYLNGTLIGQTGAFPDPPLPPQPEGYENWDENKEYPGLMPKSSQERDYFFPMCLLKPGQDNTIAVKVFLHLWSDLPGGDSAGGGILGVPDIEVAPAVGTIRGTVTSGGAGAAAVRVAATDPNGLTSCWALTDADGAFTLPNVLAGSSVVGAAKPGFFPAARSVQLPENQTRILNIDLTPVPDGPAPTYDHFDDGPDGWKARWEAIGIDNKPPDGLQISEPGYNVNTDPPVSLPGTVTTRVIYGQNGGTFASRQRASAFASVNSAGLVSAWPASTEPRFSTGPDVVFQLNGTTGNDPAGLSRSNYVDFAVESYASIGAEQRLLLRFYSDPAGLLDQVAAPITLSSLGDLSQSNPLQMTVIRIGSYYDFYLNGQPCYDLNVLKAAMGDHKLVLHPNWLLVPLTWDWVKVSSATLVPPSTRTVQALRIAGGLEETPPPGSESFRALDVVTTGPSEGAIDLLDVVALAEQGL